MTTVGYYLQRDRLGLLTWWSVDVLLLLAVAMTLYFRTAP